MLLRGALLAVLMCAAACTRQPEARRVDALDPNVAYVGWFDRRAPRSPRCAWAGSQIALRFRGSRLAVELTDTPVEDDTRETDWITVAVDDRAPKTIALREGRHVYEIDARLSQGEHRVELWKRTEAEVGVIAFHGFLLDEHGSALPPRARRTRRTVFIGDSITAGYGNEGRDGSCHWSAGSENNHATFGAVAAKALDADYLAAAWSGKGLTRNYEARDELTLPQLWNRVIPTEQDSPLVERAAADAVVINLGTNDFFRGMPSEQSFVAGYRAFLKTVRARYPEALLVIGLGPMLADDYPQPQARSSARRWLQRVLSETRTAGDGKIAFIEFWTDPAEGVGCDFHPNKKTHARMGAELAALVRDRLGW